MIIILVLIIFIIIILFSKKENLISLNSEVYNNINKFCDLENLSYFNRLNISNKAKINDKLINKYIYDVIYPKGTFYVQYKGTGVTFFDQFSDENSPNKIFPGTKWEKQWNDEGIFFRTEGQLSDVARNANGIQDWAIKRLTGKMSPVERDRYYGGPHGESGVFSAVTTDHEIAADDHDGTESGRRFIFDSTRQIKLTSDNEVRVKNQYMIIWKRIE